MDTMLSLLPYLNPDRAGFFLRIPSQCRGRGSLLQSQRPFPDISERQPCCKIQSAEIVTTAFSPIKEVFLILQKDRYSLPDDSLNPLSNADLDQMWGDFPKHHDVEQDPKLVTLSGQIGQDGRLLQFRSVFCCVQTMQFWEPCCPSCGSLLEICRDDALLASRGLPEYAASLERFLHCPQCSLIQDDTDHFYCVELTGHAPGFVKDFNFLKKQFKQLLEPGHENTGLPCRNCPQAAACFGGAEGDPPIVPLSFYPFYLLISEAPSLPAEDFFAFVSGASAADIAARHTASGDLAGAASVVSRGPNLRAGEGFFFSGTADRFLEVLYLKGIFLQALLDDLWTQKTDSELKFEALQPDLRTFWVRLPEMSPMLPFFWNFQVDRIVAEQVFALPGRGLQAFFQQGCQRLGLIWFCALLHNEQYTVKEISKRLQAVIDRSADALKQEDFEDILAEEPLFAPENIFWKAAPCDLPLDSENLWRESLILGLRLLVIDAEALEDVESIQEQLQTLLVDLKRALFDQKQPRQASLPDIDPDVNEAVQDILKRIAGRWKNQRQEKAGSSDNTGKAAVPDGEEETLLLPVDMREDQKTEDDTASLDQTFMETMFLNSFPEKDREDRPQATNFKQEESGESVDEASDEELPKTVILDVSREKPFQREQPSVEKGDHEIPAEDTPEKQAAAQQPDTSKVSKDENGSSLDADLEKTVIQRRIDGEENKGSQ